MREARRSSLTAIGYPTPITEIITLRVVTETISLELEEDMAQPPFTKIVPAGDGEADRFILTLDGVPQSLLGRTVTLSVGLPTGRVEQDCPVAADGMSAIVHWGPTLTATASGYGYRAAIRVVGGGDDPHTRLGTLKVPPQP